VLGRIPLGSNEKGVWSSHVTDSIPRNAQSGRADCGPRSLLVSPISPTPGRLTPSHTISRHAHTVFIQTTPRPRRTPSVVITSEIEVIIEVGLSSRPPPQPPEGPGTSEAWAEILVSPWKWLMPVPRRRRARGHGDPGTHRSGATIPVYGYCTSSGGNRPRNRRSLSYSAQLSFGDARPST
jgi:hypothetical protein